MANPNRSLGRILKNFQKNLHFGPIFDRNFGKHPKYRKISEFQSKIGPQKSFSGPRVGHPSYRVHIKTVITRNCFFVEVHRIFSEKLQSSQTSRYPHLLIIQLKNFLCTPKYTKKIFLMSRDNQTH